MKAIELQNVSKRFDDTTVIDNISLHVDSAEAVCLFGPSGCGKTTLLRLTAGLERPDNGQILLRDHIVSANGTFVPPTARSVGMAFQDFALWPHMSVARHLDFVLRKALPNKATRQARINELLALIELAERQNDLPRKLSGGEQQRLALARAIATRPDILLLDEPFSNLDPTLQNKLAEHLMFLKNTENTAILMATHESKEAELLDARILRI